MAEKKYLDYDGLAYFKAMLIDYVDNHANDTDSNEFMKLIKDAIPGDIAYFNEAGQVIDSGIDFDEVAMMDYIGNLPEDTDAETILEYIDEVANTDDSDMAEIKGRISAVEETVNTLADNVYTKDETDEAIAVGVANADHLKRKIVDSTEDIDATADDADQYIYMVLRTDAEDDENHYDEYMVIDGKVERVGDWAVDLSDYITKEDANTLVALSTAEAEAYAEQLVENIETISDEEIEKLFTD